jgi:hypothetical protein
MRIFCLPKHVERSFDHPLVIFLFANVRHFLHPDIYYLMRNLCHQIERADGAISSSTKARTVSLLLALL